MTLAVVFDAVRTRRGKGKWEGSLHSLKPVDLLGGLQPFCQLWTIWRNRFFPHEIKLGNTSNHLLINAWVDLVFEHATGFECDDSLRWNR